LQYIDGLLWDVLGILHRQKTDGFLNPAKEVLDGQDRWGHRVIQALSKS
jgi:hypothetical protein